MKTAIFLEGCFLLFFAGLLLGQKESAAKHLPGGADWLALTPTDREMYIDGFLMGYKLSSLQTGSLFLAKFAPEKVSSMTAAEKKDYEESSGWAHKVLPYFKGPVSSSTLRDTVTAFYSDYRNLHVCLEDSVLFSAASLRGNAASEQELSAARKQGVENGCR